MIQVRIGIAARLGVALSAFVIIQAAAQRYLQPTAQQYLQAAGGCLTAEQRKTNDAYYALTRPTSRDDPMPFFDPEYFTGTWDFEMRTQESPFGPGGESVGTLTITSTSNGCAYEGAMKGEDPDGKAFTRAIRFTYEPAKKLLSWTEQDSSGYTIVKSGPVAGELGGLFHHHFGDDQSGPATTVGGKTIRIKGVSEMSSPAYYKTVMQLSLDGGPFTTWGRVTLEKRLPDGK